MKEKTVLCSFSEFRLHSDPYGVFLVKSCKKNNKKEEELDSLGL